MDKVFHIIVSCILTTGFAFAFPVELSAFLTLCVGVGKECYDEYRYRKHQKGSGFDAFDIVADLIGISLGLFWIGLIGF